MSGKDGDDYITYREFRELADKIVKEAQALADRAHEEIYKDISNLRGSFTTYIDERRAQDIAKMAADKVAEASNEQSILDYRTKVEGRLSKLEANQYVQIALLAITIIASAVGLFKLLSGY